MKEITQNDALKILLVLGADADIRECVGFQSNTIIYSVAGHEILSIYVDFSSPKSVVKCSADMVSYDMFY